MRSLGALLLVMFVSVHAEAAEVFVNGVKIYRLTNVSLEGCTVAFDAAGNLQITAPGYEIRVQEPAPAEPAAPAYGAPAVPVAPAYGAPAVPVAPAAPAPTYGAPAAPAPAPAVGRPGFALTTWGQQTITLPLKYELAVNGTIVRAFSAADENLMIDLGPYLVQGANTLRLTVEYDSMYSGVPPTAADRFAVRIQFGRFDGAAFAPERSLVEFARDGTQMLGTIKEFQISL